MKAGGNGKLHPHKFSIIHLFLIDLIDPSKWIDMKYYKWPIKELMPSATRAEGTNQLPLFFSVVRPGES